MDTFHLLSGWLGRINYTSQRTRAMVQADKRRAIAPLQDKIEKLEADLAEVLKLLRARTA